MGVFKRIKHGFRNLRETGQKRKKARTELAKMGLSEDAIENIDASLVEKVYEDLLELEPPHRQLRIRVLEKEYGGR